MACLWTQERPYRIVSMFCWVLYWYKHSLQTVLCNFHAYTNSGIWGNMATRNCLRITLTYSWMLPYPKTIKQGNNMKVIRKNKIYKRPIAKYCVLAAKTITTYVCLFCNWEMFYKTTENKCPVCSNELIEKKHDVRKKIHNINIYNGDTAIKYSI